MHRCNRPVSPPASLAISRSAFLTIGSISSARFSNRRPADVKRGGLVFRTKRVHSSRSSRSFNWCDKADCVRKRLSAASTRLPVSRNATRVLRCLSSITPDHHHEKNSMYTHSYQNSLTLNRSASFPYRSADRLDWQSGYATMKTQHFNHPGLKNV